MLITIFIKTGEMATISPTGHLANLLPFSDYIVKNVEQFNILYIIHVC